MIRPPTPEEAAELSDILLAARVLRPYYGRALGLLRPVIHDQMPYPLAVDTSWRLYVNLEHLRTYPITMQATMIAAHEIEHLLRNHAKRTQQIPRTTDQEHVLWLCAADLEINDDLTGKELLPAGCLHPRDCGYPLGETAEEYFLRLRTDLAALPPPPGASGSGDPKCWELPPDLSEEERDHKVYSSAQGVRDWAQNHPGTVPNQIEMWANRQVVPMIPWESQLAVGIRQGLTSRGSGDWSWSKFSRRSQEVLRPSQVRSEGLVSVVVDTSGSMVDLGETVLGTVYGIARRAAQVEVLQVDSKVAAKQHGIPRKWVGGGGTNMGEGIAQASGQLIIVVTDGMTPWPETPPEVPVIVVLLSSEKVPSWVHQVIHR